MFLKKLPYWLKGAITGLFVAIIFFIILSFFKSVLIISQIHTYLVSIPIQLILNHYFVRYIFGPHYLPLPVISYFIKPLVYVIYGTIMGYIIGKLKSE